MKGQQEYAKSQNVNATLEGLCKSLQKQNQDLIDENKKLQNDEKEVRSKLASDFQTRINTISSELEKHATEHLRKTKENELYSYFFFVLKIWNFVVSERNWRKLLKSSKVVKRFLEMNTKIEVNFKKKE